jgi:hypothetical protein
LKYVSEEVETIHANTEYIVKELKSGRPGANAPTERDSDRQDPEASMREDSDKRTETVLMRISKTETSLTLAVQSTNTTLPRPPAAESAAFPLSEGVGPNPSASQSDQVVPTSITLSKLTTSLPGVLMS